MSKFNRYATKVPTVKFRTGFATLKKFMRSWQPRLQISSVYSKPATYGVKLSIYCLTNYPCNVANPPSEQEWSTYIHNLNAILDEYFPGFSASAKVATNGAWTADRKNMYTVEGFVMFDELDPRN